MKFMTFIVLSLFTTSLWAKSFTLNSIEAEIYNHTEKYITKAVVNITISCVKSNIVVGTETVSTSTVRQAIKLDPLEKSTRFFTQKISERCRGFSMWKRWIAATVHVSFPEIDNGIYKTFNRRSEKFSGAELKRELVNFLESIEVP